MHRRCRIAHLHCWEQIKNVRSRSEAFKTVASSDPQTSNGVHGRGRDVSKQVSAHRNINTWQCSQTPEKPEHTLVHWGFPKLKKQQKSRTKPWTQAECVALTDEIQFSQQSTCGSLALKVSLNLCFTYWVQLHFEGRLNIKMIVWRNLKFTQFP